MNDSRFTNARRDVQAAKAALDDARTTLADIAEEINDTTLWSMIHTTKKHISSDILSLNAVVSLLRRLENYRGSDAS
jgi:hypothetical protein